MSAPRLLARGWRRGARRWYLATVAVLAATLVVLMAVSGVLAGMQRETESRVADFYTGDLRVTPTGATRPIPPGAFTAGDARVLADAAGSASLQFESQFILRRGSLFGGALEPGQVGIGTEAGVALGGLIGYTADSAAAKRMAEHVVVGALPAPTDGTGPMPIVMSVHRLTQLLSEPEREALAWPPTPGELARLEFEVTAAVVPGNGTFAEEQDVIRRDARLVALYETDVDLLDSLTFLAPIEDVRRLHGRGGQEPIGNVILVHGDGDAARDGAAARGWGTRSPEGFTHDHLGQLMDVVRGLSFFAAAMLFVLPAFLVTHGVTRQLETHQREMAVCRAIGVPARQVRAALGVLVAQVLGGALLAAAAATLLLGVVLSLALPRAELPLPASFHLGPSAVLAGVVVAAGTCGLALLVALRSARRLDLATALRTF